MWRADVVSHGIETRRVGSIGPYRGQINKEEYPRVAPDGVSFAFTELGPWPKVDGSLRPAIETLVLPRIEPAATFLASLGCDVICQNGTPVGMIEGVGFDQELIGRIEDAAGVPATTMSTSVVDALRALDADRIAIVTTYEDDYLEIVTEFLADSGFVIDSVTSTPIRADIGDGNYGVSADYVARLAERAVADSDDPDCLLIAGGTLRTMDVLLDLERAFELPVTSSAQATLWNVFSMLDLDGPIEGYGRLLTMV